jgi:UPF0755 protein
MTTPPDREARPVDRATDDGYGQFGPDEVWYAEVPPGYRPPPPPRPPALIAAKILGALGAIALTAFLISWAAPRLADIAAGDPPEADLVAAGVPIEFSVPSGSTASGIGALLQEAGLLADGGDFERFVLVGGVADELKAGDYDLVGGMSIEAIADVIVAGPPEVDVFRLTVIEGLRIEEMLASLASQTDHDVEDFSALLLDGTITSPFLPTDLPEGTPPLTAWEGLLFPSTYEFRADATPQRILNRLNEEMIARMGNVDWSALEAAGLTPYEGLVIASLIEKEAKLDEDRPLISSVIHNRLRDGMALQIDATVIYALGENPGRVLNEDLEIDSPWNTYRYPGLPPTPIGGVRTTSLEAAANPEPTDFLYYVLIDEEGRHGFSTTLEEHQAKVEQARADGILP